MVRVGKTTFENFATCILSLAYARLTLTGSFCHRCRCISMQCNDIYFDLCKTLEQMRLQHTNRAGEYEKEIHTHPHRNTSNEEIYFIPTTQLLSNIASCPRMYLIANGRWMMTLRFQFSPLALSRSLSSISSISRSVDLAQIKPHTKRAETRQSQKSTNLSSMKYES